MNRRDDATEHEGNDDEKGPEETIISQRLCKSVILNRINLILWHGMAEEHESEEESHEFQPLVVLLNCVIQKVVVRCAFRYELRTANEMDAGSFP
ncbi:hypothetical protein AVEN_9722-1 [Araneus ventricosus]|uniref:Uncharacterized protein n=1 Tax=Araneus ventricosus TaxID=182803 RepID=A0A4Y2U9B7_ARAVE|nr:hypothetical protein AVEN_9722-1 [Araneus ventricosus]